MNAHLIVHFNVVIIYSFEKSIARALLIHDGSIRFSGAVAYI